MAKYRKSNLVIWSHCNHHLSIVGGSDDDDKMDDKSVTKKRNPKSTFLGTFLLPDTFNNLWQIFDAFLLLGGVGYAI